MARPRSRISEELPNKLELTKGALDRRWTVLTETVCRLLGYDADALKIIPDYTSELVWAGLRGSACERIQRNKGGSTFVAPIHQLRKRDDFLAWLGIQEVWDSGKGPRPYSFRQLSLTVHFGFKGDAIKPQIFRSEWAGVRDWSGQGINFQAPGAGHPHWQFDVLETLRLSEAPAVFDEDVMDNVEKFGEEPPDLDMIVRSAQIENMHFASGASWWIQEADNGKPHHMNAPADEISLTRWLSANLLYIQQELNRCRIN